MAQEQEIERVHGLAIFKGIESEQWTEEEMAPIVAVMEAVNEGARRYFSIVSWHPRGVEVGWYFFKRDVKPFGEPFWCYKWTWHGGSWSEATPEDIAAKLRKHYDWCLKPATKEITATGEPS